MKTSFPLNFPQLLDYLTPFLFSHHLTNLRCDKSMIRSVHAFASSSPISIYYWFVFTLWPKCLYLLESLKFFFIAHETFPDEREKWTFMTKIKEIFSSHIHFPDPIDKHWWQIIWWKAEKKVGEGFHCLNQFSALSFWNETQKIFSFLFIVKREYWIVSIKPLPSYIKAR